MDATLSDISCKHNGAFVSIDEENANNAIVYRLLQSPESLIVIRGKAQNSTPAANKIVVTLPKHIIENATNFSVHVTLEHDEVPLPVSVTSVRNDGTFTINLPINAGIRKTGDPDLYATTLTANWVVYCVEKESEELLTENIDEFKNIMDMNRFSCVIC